MVDVSSNLPSVSELVPQVELVEPYAVVGEVYCVVEQVGDVRGIDVYQAVLHPCLAKNLRFLQASVDSYVAGEETLESGRE